MKQWNSDVCLKKRESERERKRKSYAKRCNTADYLRIFPNGTGILPLCTPLYSPTNFLCTLLIATVQGTDQHCNPLYGNDKYTDQQCTTVSLRPKI